MPLTTFLTTTVVGMSAVVAPIVIGLVQVLKIAGLPVKWAPLCAVCLGAILGFVFHTTGNLVYDILAGVIAGLAGSGLYSGTKTTTE